MGIVSAEECPVFTGKGGGCPGLAPNPLSWNPTSRDCSKAQGTGASRNASTPALSEGYFKPERTGVKGSRPNPCPVWRA